MSTTRPVTAEELGKNPDVLLRLKAHNEQPITSAYQGKVGAVYQGGKYFIMSLNMDYILEPPFNPQVYFRSDNRLADDDYLLWPQRYTDMMCHLSCIPRINISIEPSKVTSILHQPFDSDYFVLNSTGSLLGLGQLRPDIIERLLACYEEFSGRQEKYEGNPTYSRSGLGRELLVMSKRQINFLESLPMTQKQLHFIFCQTQRRMLEYIGFIHYVTIVKPRMVSLADKIHERMDAVGAFHTSVTDAEMCFKAGLPVWLILPAKHAGTIRIDAVVETIKATDMLITEKHPTDHRGVYFAGETLPHGYRFFLDYTRHYLSGSNPFRVKVIQVPPAVSASVPPNPSSSSSSQNVASTSRSEGHSSSAIDKKNRFKPYAKPDSKHHISGAGTKQLKEPEGLIIPPSLAAWSKAFRSIDANPKNRKVEFLDCPSGLAFPDPALFVGVQTEAKRALYFTNWLRHRVAAIFRVSSTGSDPKPISSQLWRTLLNFSMSGTLADASSKLPDSKSTQRIHAIQEIFSTCTRSEDGVTINANEQEDVYWRGAQINATAVPPLNIAREIMWELFELNFRCEFTALDERMHMGTTDAEDGRQILLGKCFLDGDSSLLVVKFEDANKGLAAPLLSDRLPYILALRVVLASWVGFKEFIVGFNIPEDVRLSDSQILQLETLLAQFYAQAFFNCFGRAPILPHAL